MEENSFRAAGKETRETLDQTSSFDAIKIAEDLFNLLRNGIKQFYNNENPGIEVRKLGSNAYTIFYLKTVAGLVVAGPNATIFATENGEVGWEYCLSWDSANPKKTKELFDLSNLEEDATRKFIDFLQKSEQGLVAFTDSLK